MSNRSHQIISDLEDEYGVSLDENYSPNILCDGDTCRHDECQCWDDFKNAIEAQLVKEQEANNAEFDSMARLYRAEVSYGLHVTESAKNAADAVA